MKFTSGSKIYIIVTIVGVLMLLNAILIHQDGRRIHQNQRLLEICERIKANAQGVRQSLHLLDLGIRAYALGLDKQMYTQPRDTAISQLSKRLDYLDRRLLQLGYPDKDYADLKRSVDEYFSFIEEEVAAALENGEIDKAIKLIGEDRGYKVAIESYHFNNRVTQFIDQVSLKAEEDFSRAVNNSFWLQIVLFIMAMPTLLYSAFYYSRSIKLSYKLSMMEKEKRKILKDQNITLEKLVQERTDEILASNEEILAQNEEISSQNDEIQLRNISLEEKQQVIEEKNEILNRQNLELKEAKLTIEKQQELLQLRIAQLHDEVSKQNEELKGTNQEIIAQNSKLEQFAYIISHNLRAPIARLLGLGTLVDNSQDEEDKKNIVGMMHIASKELNQVINDVSEVLLIQKASTNRMERIKLENIVLKVRDILKNEIETANAQIISDFSAFPVLYSIPIYFESIFYNLISNAIKYRDPEREPVVKLSSKVVEDFVIINISDNGLGINLKRDRDKLFGLYKRFYFHVEGKGLGLYLVKTQVEALGAEISVSSELGKGCDFQIKIRLSKVKMP